MAQSHVHSQAHAAIEYVHQAEKLSLASFNPHTGTTDGGTAVKATFITPLDPVIETADGKRLPTVPVMEAHKFNVLQRSADVFAASRDKPSANEQESIDRLVPSLQADSNPTGNVSSNSATGENDQDNAASLNSALPPYSTHPLFPPLPLYGPPSLMRSLQCRFFRCTSFFLSTAFLATIVLGSAFTSIHLMFQHIWLRLTFRKPDARRPFYEEECRRKAKRREDERVWAREKGRRKSQSALEKEEASSPTATREDYEPTEGGPDPLACDVGYYARRVGLDVEEFKVQTEDGFIIVLWHVYNPAEYTPVPEERRKHDFPENFRNRITTLGGSVNQQYQDGRRRYPVLMMHGLLQSPGAYCANDDDSLAFYLCKSGYDVWLGSNRCGFHPEHSLLDYQDPRMWAWNIRQMGVMDLPALMSRVLEETGFEKLGLVCHSQGTTETFVALAKDQRPELGEKISVFCALAPAVYAGPLIGKMYFKFMRIISPSMFRVFFGIHSFIPLMMTMHRVLPGRLYGAMGYRVFSFLFNWSDDRWERDIRDRLFQFSPVYVSAESMRWWLGRECFATQKCILATREEGRAEDVEDEEAELKREQREEEQEEKQEAKAGGESPATRRSVRERRGRMAWYNEQVPPIALWICGSDDLVDGRRLLRRLERGREPHVKLVHQKIIEEYEHLDVLWAMDAIEKVGKEVREVLWNTARFEDKKICRLPKGIHEEDGDEGRER